MAQIPTIPKEETEFKFLTGSVTRHPFFIAHAHGCI